MKLQTKELNKMADEELEKSIDDQKSVNACRSTTPELITVTEKKKKPGFRTNLGTVNT